MDKIDNSYRDWLEYKRKTEEAKLKAAITSAAIGVFLKPKKSLWQKIKSFLGL
jgi:hypothetical protein